MKAAKKPELKKVGKKHVIGRRAEDMAGECEQIVADVRAGKKLNDRQIGAALAAILQKLDIIK